jgi:hypothetical protein
MELHQGNQSYGKGGNFRRRPKRSQDEIDHQEPAFSFATESIENAKRYLCRRADTAPQTQTRCFVFGRTKRKLGSEHRQDQSSEKLTSQGSRGGFATDTARRRHGSECRPPLLPPQLKQNRVEENPRPRERERDQERIEGETAPCASTPCNAAACRWDTYACLPAPSPHRPLLMLEGLGWEYVQAQGARDCNRDGESSSRDCGGTDTTRRSRVVQRRAVGGYSPLLGTDTTRDGNTNGFVGVT